MDLPFTDFQDSDQLCYNGGVKTKMNFKPTR